MRRFKVALKVLATDITRKIVVPCVIRDASLSGCQLISLRINELPEWIVIDVPDIKEPLRGRIAWRKDDTAGVEFEWEATSGDDRRGAKRVAVELPVVIFDDDLNEVTDCLICDASQTGCRIRGADVGDLPESIYLSIRKLTAPVPGQIVWRTAYEAGVKLAWQSKDFST